MHGADEYDFHFGAGLDDHHALRSAEVLCLVLITLRGKY